MTRRAQKRAIDPSRSENMRAIHGKDTTPEMAVRSMLHRSGYRYRLHEKSLPGCPDLVFPSRRKAIFVNGCFWHQHRCKRGRRVPKSNTAYWSQKLRRNKLRDIRSRRQLRLLGWKTLTIWQCQLRQPDRVLERARRFLGK